jgi:hypothetical protein
MDNIFKQRIGVFYKDREWAINFTNIIKKQLPQGSIYSCSWVAFQQPKMEVL